MHNVHLLDVLMLQRQDLVFFDNAVSIRCQVHHDFVAEQGADLFDWDLLRLRYIQVDDDGGDEAQAHVDEIHPIFAA